MYKKFNSLIFLMLMSGLVGTQAQDIADSIPTGIKVYVVGADSSYVVYGGDIALVDYDSAEEIVGDTEENSYHFLGSANSTHEFYGSYFYYLVRPSYGPVLQVDAFEFLGVSDCFRDPIGCNGPDDPLWYSLNFWDPPCEEGPTIGYCPQNCQGPPDGEYSCLHAFSLMSGMVCEEPPETPTVEIQCGFDTIYISKPTSKSPSYQIDALACPPGGSFKWEIISGKGSGKDKIKFLSAAEGAHKVRRENINQSQLELG